MSDDNRKTDEVPTLGDAAPSLDEKDLFANEEFPVDDSGVRPLVALPPFGGDEVTGNFPALDQTSSWPGMPNPLKSSGVMSIVRTPEVQILVSEARVAGDMGEWSRGRSALAQALDRAPNDADLHATMAWYTSLDRSIKAPERARLVQHHINVSLELTPNNPHAHTYQGRIWAVQKNLVRAKVSYEAALRARPGFQPAIDGLTRIEKGIDEDIPGVGGPKLAERVGATAKRAAKAAAKRAKYLALVLVVAGVIDFVSQSRNQEVELADEIGTGLKPISIRKDSGTLHYDVGDAWDVLRPDEKDLELDTIARGAAAIGHVNVFIYSNGQLVGEGHNGKPCRVGQCQGPP